MNYVDIILLKTLLEICIVLTTITLIIQAIEKRLDTYQKILGIINIIICLSLLNFYIKGQL